jgi:hypothetical protein
MLLRRVFISFFFSLSVISAPVPVVATPSPPQYILSHVPQAAEIGSGRLTYLFWDVYDARLFTSKGASSVTPPYALSLTYLRDLEGEKIADRSIEEIRKQGFKDEVVLATWHQQMRELFPDVKKGTTLTGVLTSEGESLFYHNGKQIGYVKDPLFGEHFFGIWLNEKTSEPTLRQALMGL